MEHVFLNVLISYCWLSHSQELQMQLYCWAQMHFWKACVHFVFQRTQTSSRLCVLRLGEREETRQPQAAPNGVTLTQRMTLSLLCTATLLLLQSPEDIFHARRVSQQTDDGIQKRRAISPSSDLAVKTASPFPASRALLGSLPFLPLWKSISHTHSVSRTLTRTSVRASLCLLVIYTQQETARSNSHPPNYHSKPPHSGKVRRNSTGVDFWYLIPSY